MASAGWQRRNARARAAGYKSYYDYRAHGFGVLPPSAPRLSGERLRQARGHASYADLLAQVESGRVEIISQIPGERDPATGRYNSVTFDVQLTSGRTARYVVRGKDLEGPRIKALRGAMTDAGSDIYVNPSLDLLSLASEDSLDQATEAWEEGFYFEEEDAG